MNIENCRKDVFKHLYRKRADDDYSRPSERKIRPVIGKDIKLPTVFTVSVSKDDAFLGGRTQNNDIPYWKKMIIETKRPLGKHLKKEYSSKLIHPRNMNDYSLKLDSQFTIKSTKNRKKRYRSSQSCPKQPDNDLKYTIVD